MTEEELERIHRLQTAALLSRQEAMQMAGLTASEMAENERLWHVENQQRIADDEYRREYNKARLEALETLFPRGHDRIPHIDKMVDIAREDQLNPIYETALREFDEAKLAMSRAANKLVQAVKLIDSEKLEEQINEQYGGRTFTTSAGVGANIGNSQTSQVLNATPHPQYNAAAIINRLRQKSSSQDQ